MTASLTGIWAKIALGGVGAGLDMLSTGFDPIGYFSGHSDAYQPQAHHVANLTKAAAGAADSLKSAATMAGELVAGIRTTVRDVIATLVGLSTVRGNVQ